MKPRFNQSSRTALLALTASVFPMQASNLPDAVVTQKINQVTLANSRESTPKAVSPGAVVRESNVLRTGSKSRAELEFGDKTLARMGANSIFSFDANTRTLDFSKGALLISKPKKSERLEIRSGAISAAITGSTAFLSITPVKLEPGLILHPDVPKETHLVGMIEGQLKGNAKWSDKGKLRTQPFSLMPGDMLVSQPGQVPVVVRFDLPRFLKTSPLLTDFKGALANAPLIEKEAARYASLQQRGFIEPTSVLAANYDSELLFVAKQGRDGAVRQNLFEAGIARLAVTAGTITHGGFVPIGANGVIRGQLVYRTSADLDLHLVLPDMQEVFFSNGSVTFNKGRATATLDTDNRGTTINIPPDSRVENIVVTGRPGPGEYRFFVRSFNTPNISDSYTLTITGNNGLTTQQLGGVLPAGADGPSIRVHRR